ncbi:hypothetical protein KEM56_000639, partial [Ascosphaera pollenicola]
HQLSYEIVTAAAKNGLDWRSCYNKRDIRLSVRLATKQWKLALENTHETVHEDKPIEERRYAFARSIEEPIRKAVNNSVDEMALKWKEWKRRDCKSFRLRNAEQALDRDRHHRKTHRSKPHRTTEPSDQVTTSTPTDPELQRRLDFISYSLKISDMTIDDFKMELDMEARRVQLAQLKRDLATMKDSIHV